MRVLSLFDGISCARVALDRAGITVDEYYAAEIEPNAIKVALKNYPKTQPIGDVKKLCGDCLLDIDLLIGGSPCQDLSIAKKGRKGLDGDRSGLFWQWVRLWKEVKPKWWVLENVASMPQKDRDIITKELGVEPVMFNAALVSAQSRKRLFWTNIPFTLPEDQGILLKDILQPECDVSERMTVKGKCVATAQTGRNETKKLGFMNGLDHQANRVYDDAGKLPALASVCNSMVKVGHIGNSDSQGNRVYDANGKSATLSANGGGLGAKTGLYKVDLPTSTIRKLTPIECERLQGLPDNYTDCVANTNRYKCLGNAFNVDVVAHILRGMNFVAD